MPLPLPPHRLIPPTMPAGLSFPNRRRPSRELSSASSFASTVASSLLLPLSLSLSNLLQVSVAQLRVFVSLLEESAKGINSTSVHQAAYAAILQMVLGNAKGAVAVMVSILIFRNPVSVTIMLGYSLTVVRVVLYSEAKKRSKS